MDRRELGLLAGLAGLLVAGVLARPYLPVDETRYLSVAWEMHLSGDPLHLSRNFEPYAHKPPLLFWLINLVWLVTGVTDLGARLVGPACAVAAVAATGALARRLWPGDRDAGLRAMLALSGFTLFTLYGGATMFDALLTLAVISGAAVLWRIGQGGAGARHWAALGLALGLGMLAKGPVVLVHLVPLVLLARLWAPVPPGAVAMARGLGLAVAVGLGVVSLWLGPALMTADAAFRHELLWTQSAGRVAGSMGHSRPVWFLWLWLPLLLFPFGWIPGLWRAAPAVLRADRAARFAGLWALSALVLFSAISGKQVHYLMPELPALALLVARLGRDLPARAGLRPAALALLALAGLALAAAAGAMRLPDLLSSHTAGVGLAAFGAVVAGLALVAWRAPLLIGHAVAGAGLTLALSLAVAATGAGAAYDPRPIAARLSRAAPDGIALVGMSYNAEFNYAARLTVPVDTPATDIALADWVRTHAGGTVFGPIDRVGRDDPPVATERYGTRTFGFWPAEPGTN